MLLNTVCRFVCLFIYTTGSSYIVHNDINLERSCLPLQVLGLWVTLPTTVCVLRKTSPQCDAPRALDRYPALILVPEVHSEPHWVNQHLPSTAVPGGPGTSETHAKVHDTDPLPKSKAGLTGKTGSREADIHGRVLWSRVSHVWSETQHLGQTIATTLQQDQPGMG